MDKEETNLEFPCDFPIKIMGASDSNLEDKVLPIIKKHVEYKSNSELKFQVKESKKGNYISLTIVIRADSKAQLDNIYSELSALPEVLFVL